MIPVACPHCPLIRLGWAITKLMLMDAQQYASNDDLIEATTLINYAIEGSFQFNG